MYWVMSATSLSGLTRSFFFIAFLIFFGSRVNDDYFGFFFFFKKYQLSRYLFCDKKMIGPQQRCASHLSNNYRLHRCASHLSNNYCPLGPTCKILTTSFRFVGALFFLIFFNWFIFILSFYIFIQGIDDHFFRSLSMVSSHEFFFDL